jgi:ABC-type cobalamin/Fe3+-siderophores transport system ATPase subunit
VELFSGPIISQRGQSPISPLPLTAYAIFDYTKEENDSQHPTVGHYRSLPNLGVALVVFGLCYPVTFAGLTDAAFTQIRQYGRTSAAVTIRLLETLAVVAALTSREDDRGARRHQGRVRHVRLFGGLARADLQAVDMALEHVGISDLATRSFLELSGGERQLVLIARALAADCQALLLDEPFASLDLDNQRRILSLLEPLARGHDLGIIFSAHHPDHVLAIADAVVVLTRGEVPAVWGPVDQVLTEGLLRQTYGVPVEILELPQPESQRRYAVPLL